MMDTSKAKTPWHMPAIPDIIPQGDMPGDKICIGDEHIQKAQTIFPKLLELVTECLSINPNQRTVVTICGGSGVGKSEIASLLSYFFNDLGIGAYTLSGDNYPHRYPAVNDTERMRVFRNGGLSGLIVNGLYEQSYTAILKQLWQQDADASPESLKEYPWLEIYQKAGKDALRGYLGTEKEINFRELETIVGSFKQGALKLHLKRMGRSETELWYELVDMSKTRVLVIEWTHGNSDWYQGVDIPVLLNSTPAETLAHRRSRNRDGRADSPFTTMILELEQHLLESQAHKAKIILSKSGELMTYNAYRSLMA